MADSARYKWSHGNKEGLTGLWIHIFHVNIFYLELDIFSKIKLIGHINKHGIKNA